MNVVQLNYCQTICLVSWFRLWSLSVLSTGEKYNESTALVITFVVNNHVDEKQNEKARAWELEFLRFMKNFSDPDMIIAYSAEVRIHRLGVKPR